MEFTFIVVIISFVYLLTVNSRNRRKIKYLRNKVFELEQTLEIILVYGKEKAEKGEIGKASEAFKEEERQCDNQLDP